MSENESEKGAPGATKGSEQAAGEEASAQSIENMINELEARAEKAETEMKSLHERLLRTAADFENWKKRAKKEQEEASGKGREQLIKEILPVIDNLERALKHAPGDDPLAQGVRMVEKQLLQALEKFGIVRFSAMGQPFDPAMHDAIQQVETTDVAPNTVAQEFASGYTVNGRLLRAAMVAVSKAPAQASETN